MAERKVYPKGIIAFGKNPKAPEFVVGTLVVTPNDLVEWLKDDGNQHLKDYNGRKQLKLQITKGDDGKLSLSVDTYVPKNNAAPF